MASLTFSEKTTFNTICKVIEQISHAKNKAQKVEIMQTFMTSYRNQSKNHQNDSFFPILRLLIPHLDRERGPYGIKETILAKTYVRILCLSSHSKDAQKLLNYRSHHSDGGHGDFAEMAYCILRSRFSDGESLTVHQVNLHLDNIATKHAEHDPRGVDAELQAMILKMSPMEQKWLIRVLLKDMHLGLSHGKILHMFHQDANDYFDVTNDIQKMCSTLKDPSIRLNEIAVSLFQPFKPMLCQRCDIQQIGKEIKMADAYYVEIKFDGERFQVHMQNGEFKYFSRNGFDYTDTFGCNELNGILTPKLVKYLNPRAKSCILDGEMMCWNTRQKCYTTKGMDIDVKFLKIATVHQPCFCVFDILYLNGEVLTNKPLVDRFKIMEELIQPEEGVFVISKKDIAKLGLVHMNIKNHCFITQNISSGLCYIPYTTKDSGAQLLLHRDIMGLLNQAIDNCEEGIVVKDTTAVYKPNARNAGWYKIKPEYTEGLMVELDLLIIGGYYGKGRRLGVISQFLLGVADSKRNEDNEPVLFYSVGRVGSGCSDEELQELNSKLEKSWTRVKPNMTPSGVQWSKEKPDVWIKPSASCILQVKATELVPSDAFKVGYALRFPRVQKVRYDKPWCDCLTLDELTNIRQASGGKLTASYVEKLKEAPSKRTIKRNRVELAVDKECQAKKMRNAVTVSTLFESREFCVLSGVDDSISKTDLEAKIIENGGSVVQHPGTDTFCVIANEKTVRVANVIQSNKYDVVKPSWLFECIDTNVLQKWRPDHFLAMAPNTKNRMSEEFDCYGDSYTELISEDRLRQLMSNMVVDDNATIDVDEMVALDGELFGGENPLAIFRGCFACFHGDGSAVNRVEMYKEMFKFHGGIAQEEVNERTTHIVIFGKTELPHDIESQIMSRTVRIVNDAWIAESWDSDTRLSETGYPFRVA